VQQLKRDLQKEAQALVDSREIDEFRFSASSKHKRLEFKSQGKWHHVIYPGTPRTGFQGNFVRQNIRRKLKEIRR
jgi:hypothetical protein